MSMIHEITEKLKVEEYLGAQKPFWLSGFRDDDSSDENKQWKYDKMSSIFVGNVYTYLSVKYKGYPTGFIP